MTSQPAPRARDLGIVIGEGRPGPFNAITDVSGVRVDESDLSPRFGTHVSEVVRGWKFAPSTRGGEPIASELRLRIPIAIR